MKKKISYDEAVKIVEEYNQAKKEKETEVTKEQQEIIDFATNLHKEKDEKIAQENLEKESKQKQTTEKLLEIIKQLKISDNKNNSTIEELTSIIKDGKQDQKADKEKDKESVFNKNSYDKATDDFTNEFLGIKEKEINNE